MAMQRSREHTEWGYESMPDLASASSSDTGTTAGSPDSVAPTKIKKYTKSSPLKKPHHNVGLWRQILRLWYEHIRDYLLRCGSSPDDLEKYSETDLKDLLREVGEIPTPVRVRYGKRFKISVASIITMGNPSMEPSQAASSGVPTQGSGASSQPLFSTPAHSLLAAPQPISVTPSSSFNLFSSPMSHVGTLTTHCDSTNSASEALHADPPSQANINAPGSQPTAAQAVEQLIQDASQPLSQAVPSLVKHVPWRVGDVLAVHARARGSVWYCVVESFEDQDGPAHVLFGGGGR